MKISLVMPTLNVERYVSEALDSVATQNCPHDLEVIVADGGSQDATLDIIRKYDFVHLLDGTDNGIYDGFNRGIAAASGDVVGILNADDLLPTGTLERVYNAFNGEMRPDFISGGITQGRTSDGGPVMLHTKPLSIAGALHGIPAINARYFSKNTMKAVGAFRQDAGLAADREFMMRLSMLDLESINIEHPLYHYRIHAGSSTIAGDSAARLRVWRAEVQLADFLLNGTDQNAEIIKVAKQTKALACAKKWMFDRSNRDKNAPAAPDIPALCIADLAHLPGALLAWHRWRGRLSGY